MSASKQGSKLARGAQKMLGDNVPLTPTVDTKDTKLKNQNKYVRDGPHLWVATLLNSKGCLSSKGIWEEFLKD